MATAVATYHDSPLLRTLGSSLLAASSRLYNSLPDDAEQPDVSQIHLQALGLLFAKHEVTNLLGLHLIHGHFKIPPDNIMLGTKFRDDASGRWTKPTAISGINKDSIHGHIFALTDDRHFIAYEYREGARDLSAIKMEFFADFIEYLLKHELDSLLGLEVLDECDAMVEFVLDCGGTVMLKEKDAIYGKVFKTTGWQFSSDGSISHGNGQSHAETVKGTHQVFTGSKPLRTIEALKELLMAENLVR